jgi:hypothetical protein
LFSFVWFFAFSIPLSFPLNPNPLSPAQEIVFTVSQMMSIEKEEKKKEKEAKEAPVEEVRNSSW